MWYYKQNTTLEESRALFIYNDLISSSLEGKKRISSSLNPEDIFRVA